MRKEKKRENKVTVRARKQSEESVKREVKARREREGK